MPVSASHERDVTDPRDWRSTREEAVSFRDFIEDSVRDALSDINKRFVTAKDREDLEYALKRLPTAFCEMEKLITPLIDARPAQANYFYEKLWEFIAACWIAGSRGGVTETAEVFFRWKQQSERGKNGGSASAVSRRTAAKGRELTLLKSAITARSDNPSLSQEALATAVLNIESTHGRRPSHKTVLRTIQKEEKSGRLAPRKKKFQR